MRGYIAPMGTRVLTTVEEYLQTQFEGSDRDYVDGEVVARHWGELPHAILQAQLVYLLRGASQHRALCYTPADPGGALVDDLRTSNPDLHIPLADLFAALK